MNIIHFKRKEFACRCGCGFDVVDVDLLEVLIDIRAHFKCPVHINSACRCARHNRHIGSKETSRHVKGKAVDIVVGSFTPVQVRSYLVAKYPHKFGIGLYDSFVHVDVREEKARW